MTFFPHTLLPLHVFEARYRAMVTDCLARDRRLAVVSLKAGYEDEYEGKPAVHSVAGAGQIIQWERLPTGRFNILVKGDSRVRIEREMPTDTLYRLVRARPLTETGADRPAVKALAERAKERCLRIFEAVGRSTPGMRDAMNAVAAPAALCDQVAAAVIPGAPLRQSLLEELDVERRLERLTAILDQLLKRLSEER